MNTATHQCEHSRDPREVYGLETRTTPPTRIRSPVPVEVRATMRLPLNTLISEPTIPCSQPVAS